MEGGTPRASPRVTKTPQEQGGEGKLRHGRGRSRRKTFPRKRWPRERPGWAGGSAWDPFPEHIPRFPLFYIPKSGKQRGTEPGWRWETEARPSIRERIPLLSRYPIFPLFRYPIFPLSRYPIFPFSRYPVFPLSRFPFIPFSGFPVFPLSRRADPTPRSRFSLPLSSRSSCG